MPAPLQNHPVPGQRFGSWTVLEKRGLAHGGHRMILCRCDCGVESDVASHALRTGRSRGCDPCGRKKASAKMCIDHARKRYGKWTVIDRAPNDKSGLTRWNCICLCGRRTMVYSYSLNKGISRGCGCKARPGAHARNIVLRVYQWAARKRGLEWALPEPLVWLLFLAPCVYCGQLPSNHKQTARGSFVYSGIDRIDNAKGYTIDNCIPCCEVCNKAKMQMSCSDFLAWIERIAARFRT